MDLFFEHPGFEVRLLSYIYQRDLLAGWRGTNTRHTRLGRPTLEARTQVCTHRHTRDFYSIYTFLVVAGNTP